MIGYLDGTAHGDVVLVAGVGYLVHTPNPLPDGHAVQLWVVTIVRENDISLFGFLSRGERELFGHLMKAPGVGGKVALGILSLGADVVAAALAAGDADVLAQAPGIGVKKAASILAAVNAPAALLTELAGAGGVPALLTQLAGALAALGFPEAGAKAALSRQMAAGVTGERELMRAAMLELRAA